MASPCLDNGVGNSMHWADKGSIERISCSTYKSVIHNLSFNQALLEKAIQKVDKSNIAYKRLHFVGDYCVDTAACILP